MAITFHGNILCDTSRLSGNVRKSSIPSRFSRLVTHTTSVWQDKNQKRVNTNSMLQSYCTSGITKTCEYQFIFLSIWAGQTCNSRALALTRVSTPSLPVPPSHITLLHCRGRREKRTECRIINAKRLHESKRRQSDCK